MNDYLVTLAAYSSTAGALWLFTRKSKVGYIRWQWRKPHWILARLLVVFVILHAAFALAGISAMWGYLLVGMICGLAFLADYAGLFVLLFGSVGFVCREWIFWLPSRHQLILRNHRPTEGATLKHLIGATGTAVSDLKPAGKILIANTEYPARSQGALVRKGTPVVVQSVGDFELLVQFVDH